KGRRGGCNRNAHEVDPGVSGQRLATPRAVLGDKRDIGGHYAHALEPSVMQGSPCSSHVCGPQVKKPTAEPRPGQIGGHPPIGEHSIDSPEWVSTECLPYAPLRGSEGPRIASLVS